MTLQQIQDFVLAHPAQSILGTPVGGAKFAQARRENAFRFTNQVAHDLREAGVDAGLLIKPDGDGAFGYSADRIVLVMDPTARARHYDIVFASEAEEAIPSWGDDGPIDAGRMGAPLREHLLDPGEDTPEPPAPVPPLPPLPGPDPVPNPDEVIQTILLSLRRLFDGQAALSQQLEMVLTNHAVINPTLELIKVNTAAISAELGAMAAALSAKLDAIEGSKGFTGTAEIPYLGRAAIDLVPKP